jgi:hypothetical protein
LGGFFSVHKGKLEDKQDGQDNQDKEEFGEWDLDWVSFWTL